MCVNTRIEAEREGKKEKEGRERGRDMERDYIHTIIEIK